jgi:hypothetical protein
MTKIQNDKPMFGSLDIEIWGFLGIWCLEFEISEYLNTPDSISKDYPSIGYGAVKFHKRVRRGMIKKRSIHNSI